MTFVISISLEGISAASVALLTALETLPVYFETLSIVPEAPSGASEARCVAS